MNDTHICFCIPARYGSNRLSKKLLLKIGEYTCIERTFIQVTKSVYSHNNIFILTDSEEIKEIMSKYDVNIIMTSLNCSNGTERISKYIGDIPENYKYIVNIQADEPFISPKNIDHCIEQHIKNNDDNVFYTTLHEDNNTVEYLESTASL